MYGFNIRYSKELLNNFLTLSSNLICSCETNINLKSLGKDIQPTFLRNDKNIILELSNNDREKFFNKQFFGSLIIDADHSLVLISNIVIHWCWENKFFSNNFSVLLIDFITNPNMFFFFLFLGLL
jgi:hypothetical protein